MRLQIQGVQGNKTEDGEMRRERLAGIEFGQDAPIVGDFYTIAEIGGIGVKTEGRENAGNERLGRNCAEFELVGFALVFDLEPGIETVTFLGCGVGSQLTG